MRVIVPPLKIQGIKTKLIPHIKDLILWDMKGCWHEPFMGSGAVGFNILPRKAVFSDINPHIINFYNSIKLKKFDFITVKDFLGEEGNKLREKGEQHFLDIRERFNSFYSPLDFLFLNRSCFNGIMRFNKKGHFNVPFCKKINRFSKSYITKIVNQVKNVSNIIYNNDYSFVCQNFTVALEHINSDDFVYCDPPYLGRYTDYFNQWNYELENQLQNILLNINCKIILSTWESNSHRKNDNKIFNIYNITKIPHFYHVGGKKINRNSIIEALIYN